MLVNRSTKLDTFFSIERNQYLLPSPAKLNLWLYINCKRAHDGYHELQSLFQLLDYCDWLTFTPRNDDIINITCSNSALTGHDNLVFMAIALLQKKIPTRKNTHYGLDVYLEKNIPIGGGLGGGSSNAATTLLALNRLWQANFSMPELTELGLTLGADVPFFIHGHAAFCEGIGEKITFCELPTKWYLVLTPQISISTVKIFSHPTLTRNTPRRTLSALLKQPYKNDCEQTVITLYPEVKACLDWLTQYAPAYLTGTGACIFAEFDSKQQAQAILDKIPDLFAGFVAQGCNYSPLYGI